RGFPMPLPPGVDLQPVFPLQDHLGELSGLSRQYSLKVLVFNIQSVTGSRHAQVCLVIGKLRIGITKKYHVGALFFSVTVCEKKQFTDPLIASAHLGEDL